MQQSLIWILVALLSLLHVAGLEPFYVEGDEVLALNATNFEMNIRNKAWMVEFYAPWCMHCQRLKPEWDRAARVLQGVVSFGAVNVDESRELGVTYGVQHLPTIFFMYDDGHVEKVLYKNRHRAENLVDFALQQVRQLADKRLGKDLDEWHSGSDDEASMAPLYTDDSGVLHLLEEDFGALLVILGCVQCDKCNKVKGDVLEAQKQLAGEVFFASVNCRQARSLCAWHKIGEHPTFKFFGRNKRQPLMYTGAHEATAMVEFARQQLALDAAAAGSEAVLELIDLQVWGENCIGSHCKSIEPKKLCFVAFLPTDAKSEAAGRSEYLNALATAARLHEDSGDYGFMWAQGGAQPFLEANMGVDGSTYPALVAFAPANNSYVSRNGAIDQEAVLDFVEQTTSGALIPSFPVNGKPAEILGLPEWDAGDFGAKDEL